MAKKVYCRLDDDVIEKLDAYVIQHGIKDRSTAMRLAIIEQLKREPPKRSPRGVKKKRGNPKIGEQSAAGVEARWGNKETDVPETE